MKQLKVQFHGRGEIKGYIFTQISMTDKAFIYEVSYGDSKYYEVFKKKENRQYACVSYPTSKAFGFWAWTSMNLKSAIKRFDELNTTKNII